MNCELKLDNCITFSTISAFLAKKNANFDPRDSLLKAVRDPSSFRIFSNNGDHFQVLPVCLLLHMSDIKLCAVFHILVFVSVDLAFFDQNLQSLAHLSKLVFVSAGLLRIFTRNERRLV